MSVREEILPILNQRIKNAGNWSLFDFDEITEIRVRIGKPVVVHQKNREYILTKNDTKEPVFAERKDILQIMDNITNYSLYAFENELSEGFLTVLGGHRIGICGNVLENNGHICNQTDISSLNIRVAHEVKGCGENIYPYLFDSGNSLFNTLIFSPPGKGKTTLLRDLIRLISNGSNRISGKNIAVVDERMEIGAAYCGVPQMDLGLRTDVSSGGKKSFVMPLLLRSMAPEIIAVDEIGSREDFLQISQMTTCGVNVIATIHCQEIRQLEPILKNGIFQRVIEPKMEDDQFYGVLYDEKKSIIWEGTLCST